MLKYVAWRIVMMVPTLFVISIVSFIVIQLPPGDFLTSYVAAMTARGEKRTGRVRLPARASDRRSGISLTYRISATSSAIGIDAAIGSHESAPPVCTT